MEIQLVRCSDVHGGGRSDLALVVSDRTALLKVVTSGTIISTMPPVPLPKRACNKAHFVVGLEH